MQTNHSISLIYLLKDKQSKGETAIIENLFCVEMCNDTDIRKY